MDTPTVATPSPSSHIHTPPAPQHGYEDSWEPYTPRKSARISQRAAARHRTPSPSSRHSDIHRNSLGSPRSSKRNHPATTMASPAISPKKKRAPAVDSVRRASGTLTVEGTTHAAVALGLSPAPKPETRSTRSAISTAAGMLITPAKTPQKPPTEQSKAKVKAIARNLFHSEDEIMPSPKKARTKKYTLDSFCADDEVDEPIPIFTDSHERIPEVDNSTDNPFYVNNTAPPPSPTKRRSTRQTVTIPGEGKVSVEEAIRREDGMLIVFRGKKQFRKFTENDEASASIREALDETDGGLDSVVESRLRRPLTRSAVKPRLLFPAAKAEPDPKPIDEEDEEAETDIEDHVLAGLEDKNPSTPMDLVEAVPDTPEAPRFAPVSPPSTARTTRFGNKVAAETTPMKKKPGGKRNPFDGWRRVKGGSSDTQGHKRPGDDTLPTGPAKRART
ncbi:hypothetical protein QBC46DRAFT_277274 [Diplogelasinospora grovesii]|uniref:Uncharacterized protein n=1 Tax=Diplogelasinospora grovesii TaxID=303347 RepID=A0AAN6NL27_9PEZI|nr:hypothetical protein QBC46DRAFT_277274 [Diplogelasinospora grovesii]